MTSRPSDPQAPGAPDTRAADDTTDARRAVEAEIEELGDPETGPDLPATSVAAQSTLRRSMPTGRSRAASERTGLTREIFRLGWPVMLSQALVSVSGLLDRAMIGRLGGEAGSAVPLAAVGYSTQLFFLIQSALFAVGLSCVALMARSIGAGRPDRAREALAASLQVAVGVTLVFVLILLAAPGSLLGLLGAQPEVIDVALPYLRLIVGSSVILSIVLTLDAGQRANRNTRTPMLISISMTLIKLVGNVLLIFGYLGFPRLGLLGAGLATLISQAAGLGLYLWLMSRQQEDSPLFIRFRTLFRPQPLRAEVLRIAAPGIAERVVLNLGLLSYFWVLSNYYGTVAVAAYTVGVPLLSFSWIPGNGYAQACATLVGQRLGGGDPNGATATGKRAALLALATAVPLGILFALFRTPLARMFTDDLQVIAALGPFMLALAIGQPFLQLHFTLGGAHRGAGDTWTPLLGATIGNWLFRVPLACLFAIVLEWDVIWVWYALIVDHAARASLLLWSFRRGRWKERRVGV
jgi:putative MATE family efflux protein